MGSPPKQQTITADAESTAEIDEEDSSLQADTIEQHIPKKLRQQTFVEGKTILPGAYRIWEEADDLAINMKGDWLELRLDGNKLAVSPITLHFEDGFDECAGVKTKTLSGTAQTLMVAQIDKIKQGIYKATAIQNKRIWPKEKLDFTFHGQSYQLQGSGQIASSEVFSDEDGRQEIFHAVSAYELQLQDQQGDIVTLVSEESFNDTFIELKFIGDLDGDDKPDFIIAVPRHYEEDRILLLLSTDRDDRKMSVYEAMRQFDC